MKKIVIIINALIIFYNNNNDNDIHETGWNVNFYARAINDRLVVVKDIIGYQGYRVVQTEKHGKRTGSESFLAFILKKSNFLTNDSHSTPSITW